MVIGCTIATCRPSATISCMRILTRQRTGEEGVTRPGWLLALAGVLLAVVVAILARQRISDALGWAKQNWLSATALSTAAAVAGVLVPFVIRWLDRRRPGQAVQAIHDGRQRRVMLQRVRYKWITGVLEPSLAHAAQLALGLERRPDTLDLGSGSSTGRTARLGRCRHGLPPTGRTRWLCGQG
jgi:hypothetical protein